MRPSASLSASACGPLSSVNTFRSVFPARYGHGAGLVTKKRGKRTGAVTLQAVLVQAFQQCYVEAVPAENRINHKFARLERYFPHIDRSWPPDWPDTGQSVGQSVNGCRSHGAQLADHRTAQQPVLERVV